MNKNNLNVAYLGMGIMGSAMAINLAKSGFNLRIWNRSKDKATILKVQEAGALFCHSIQETVAAADIIILCLSDAPDLKNVLFSNPDGVVSNAKIGSIIIDMSTSGPDCAKEVANELASSNLQFLDAPVSGGDIGARNGTLTIMVGGNYANYEKCLPVFQAMGKSIHHCGDIGSGQALKLCNQVLCAINMMSLCESLKLAEHLNINPELMIQVCSSGAAASWALTNLGPKIAHHDFEPGFMIKDMQKDLRLVMNSLKSADFELTASLLAQEMFCLASNRSDEKKGTQAMYYSYKNSTQS